MGIRSRWGGKAVVVVAVVATLALTFSASAAFGAGAVPFKDAAFNGYATGTVLHADLLQSGDTRVVNADEAFTGSAVNTGGVPRIKNEVQRVVAPAQPTKNSYGRGGALEIGLGAAPDDPETLALAGKAESAAPPSTPLNTQEFAVPAGPLAYASLLRGQSQALWSDSQCILGQDISFGRAHAADVQLLSTDVTVNPDDTLDLPLLSTDTSFVDSGRAVASSYSHEYFDVQKDKDGHPIGTAWGLVSEARMTLAPITLFKGTDNETTIEVGGEWVLKAFAGGIPGTSWVKFGPEDTSNPTAPIVTIHQNGVANRILTLEQILGDAGIDIPLDPVAHVTIGEAPRAIGGAFGSSPQTSSNGTVTSAAVDVVKVVVGDVAEDTHLADVRVGHMEVQTQVPAGGIDCGIPVTKKANPPGVEVNQSFVVTIKIDNPFGCDLTAVKVVDDITTKGGARFEVVDTNPNADSVPAGDHLDSGTITWNNIGSIPKGGTKSITATFKAENVNNQGGEIDDIANVSAVLGNCNGQGEGNEIVGHSLPLRVPVVLKLKLPPTGVGTSPAAYLIALMLLSLAGVGIRQLRRTKI